ncbi:MAG: Gfo/Idh/MocA family oxidoreductase [Planctomycetota bacterium]
MMTSRRTWLTGLTAAASMTISRTSSASTKDPIRVGQIGVGHGHASKLSVYRQSSDYEVVGIVEADPALRAKAEKAPAFQGVPWMSEEQLLQTPGLQAVLVETSPAECLDVAELCIDAGLHVHLDKPAGESIEQYERILKQAATKRLMVQMGYMFRYNPGFLLLEDLLREEVLGEIFEVHGVMSKVVDPENRTRHARFPGGMMFELGCHLVDLVVRILGAPTQVSSFSQTSSRAQDKLADNMLSVLTYPHTIATIKSSALEVEGFARRHLVVCGSRGTFHMQPLDQPTVNLTLTHAVGEYRVGENKRSFPPFERYVADAMQMAHVIRGESEVDYDASHDRLVQRTLLQACGLR